ncbi:CRISPR type AFERR-associated protein Csf2 [Mycobacteroides abscessus subsp. bolletii]|uniref:RAMP superfamily CRISPR-associated protein n=1 Tax=Mycobacteroides abscessus TaxID=36809 RepID=UPI0009A8AD8A|nr:RAMP superfamily CRISPR-associated protein [Mycobacteroides abscessus]SKY97589.1 CRISPR type AFERR-associated protein Csf2 [Mycobacteroides abscessus subsp. bolletii]
MSLLSTITFDVDVLARSSIVHREDYSALGTDTMALFRREKIISPAGTETLVPIVSGSSLRGVLRRIGERLTAAILNYEDTLPVPAAHLLSNGGRLAKSARPLTDEQERTLKTLIPQVAVFGGSASGRIMGGLLKVDKVLPEIAELAHILPRPPQSPLRPAVLGIADEAFTHLPDHRPSTAAAPRNDSDDKTSPLGHFEVETLPAGTRLQTGVRLTDATPPQAAFLIEVLNVFSESGHLGGRIAAGHGRISATITPRVERGQLPDRNVDWAAELAAHRDDALAALINLT